jgi:hypothetical protein
VKNFETGLVQAHRRYLNVSEALNSGDSWQVYSSREQKQSYSSQFDGGVSSHSYCSEHEEGHIIVALNVPKTSSPAVEKEFHHSYWMIPSECVLILSPFVGHLSMMLAIERKYLEIRMDPTDQ